MREALHEVELPEQTLTLQQVATSEEADGLSFHGSPTVLINGEDPFAEPSAAVGLMCRLYQTVAGFAGSPTHEQLVEARSGPACSALVGRRAY